MNPSPALTNSRIIPARAGFTGTILTCAPSAGDHPRSRGVYPSLMLKVLARKGSSPLARGLQAYFQAARNVGRIIPARAGFTTHHPSRKHTIPDHPRSRGVYESKTIKPRRHAGSSPLARGLPVDDNTLRRAFRIIPARAGFTKDKALRGAQNRDHPRSRGVYVDIWATTADGFGSSPLARGLRWRALRSRLRSGIIPARAGFTSTNILQDASLQDHPRSRGVYSVPASSDEWNEGSSPLARGLQCP